MKAEMLLFIPYIAIFAVFYNRRTEVHRNQSGGINKNEILVIAENRRWPAILPGPSLRKKI